MIKEGRQSNQIKIKKQDLDKVTAQVLSQSAWGKRKEGLTRGLVHQDKRIKRPRYKVKDID